LLSQALGTDLKGKLSIGIYATAIAAAFINFWIGLALYFVLLQFGSCQINVENKLKEENE